MISTLLPGAKLRLSKHWDAVMPSNAPRNVQARIRRIAAENVEELVALWRKRMAHGEDLTTDADVDAALERAQQFDKVPRALEAKYDAAVDALILQLTNGRRFIVPREELKGLENATPAQLSEIEVYGGMSLAWPHLDVDHYLPYLFEKNEECAKLMHELQQEVARV